MTERELTLEDVIIFATNSHKGIKDKQDEAYILHPLRVMLNVPSFLGESACIVALLHDVVEDCEVTLEQLRELGLTEDEVRAVDLLSRKPEGHPDRVTYTEFIKQIAEADGFAGELARYVKITDIKDNLGRMTPTLDGLEIRYNKALIMLYDHLAVRGTERRLEA